MKRTDLAKSLAMKIRGQMQQAPTPGRFGAPAGAPPDRREQRKLDQAAGLVPFAVKLHNELVKRLNEKAEQEGLSIHELTGRLLQAGLASGGAEPAVKPAAKKAPAGKAVVAKKAAKQAATKKAATKKSTQPSKD